MRACGQARRSRSPSATYASARSSSSDPPRSESSGTPRPDDCAPCGSCRCSLRTSTHGELHAARRATRRSSFRRQAAACGHGMTGRTGSGGVSDPRRPRQRRGRPPIRPTTQLLLAAALRRPHDHRGRAPGGARPVDEPGHLPARDRRAGRHRAGPGRRADPTRPREPRTRFVPAGPGASARRCGKEAESLLMAASRRPDSTRGTPSLRAKNGRHTPAYVSARQHTKTPAYDPQRRIGQIGSRTLASAQAGMLVCAECARCADRADDRRGCRRAGSRGGAGPGREGERSQARALAAAGPPHWRVPASRAAAGGRGAWRRARVLDRRRARWGADGSLRQPPRGVLSVVRARVPR
jgi:hypothetical protein